MQLTTVFLLLVWPIQFAAAKSNSPFAQAVSSSQHAQCGDPFERYRNECKIGPPAEVYKNGQCILADTEATVRVAQDIQRHIITYPKQIELAERFFTMKNRPIKDYEHYLILMSRSNCEAGLGNWRKIFNSIEFYPKALPEIQRSFRATVFDNDYRSQSPLSVTIDALLYRYAAEYGIYDMDAKAAFELSDLIRRMKKETREISLQWRQLSLDANDELIPFKKLPRTALFKLLKREWNLAKVYRKKLDAWKARHEFSWD